MGIIAPNQKKLIVPRKGAKIPNAPVSQSDHDANMRAIEQWANAQAPGGVQQLVAGTNITLDPTDGTGVVTINASGGSSTHYASLTGVGETTTPGALTQAGDLTVNGSTTTGLTVNGQANFNSSGTGISGFLVSMSLGNIRITQSGTGALTILNNNTTGSAGITIQSTNAGVNLIGPANNIELLTNGGISIQAGGSVPTVSISGTTVNIGGTGTTSVSGGVATQVGQAGANLGFYGVTPVGRQSSASITTVAQLVTALKDLGLLS